MTNNNNNGGLLARALRLEDAEKKKNLLKITLHHRKYPNL
jgi:hypothetical protein